MVDLHESTFIIFSHHSGTKWFLKSLPFWSLKSGGCSLTHWLPITSILFRIVRICPSLFKGNYLKNKNLFLSFFPLMESTSNFKSFFNKGRLSQLMYFQNYRLSKIRLDHLMKNATTEYPSRVNMLKDPKHIWNLHESTFIIFSHYYESKWFGKFVPWWSLKSRGCLLTHWMPITSVLFRIVRIWRSLLKCTSLKNKNLFPSFLFNSWNTQEILNIFK